MGKTTDVIWCPTCEKETCHFYCALDKNAKILRWVCDKCGGRRE